MEALLVAFGTGVALRSFAGKPAPTGVGAGLQGADWISERDTGH